MIFTPSRFVVVDDKKEHLNAVVAAFDSLGSPCLAIQYSAEDGVKPEPFRGVRCLMLDLHLVDNVQGSAHDRHYGVLTSILEQVISPTGGPYLLILWTEHPDRGEEFQKYLDAHIAPEKVHAIPVAVIPMSKSEFINVKTGVEQSPGKILDQIKSNLSSVPQLAALLQWESDTHIATGETIASVLEMIPSTVSGVGARLAALSSILCQIAIATVGLKNIEKNKRDAISAALVPILADRVANQPQTVEQTSLWDSAVSVPTGGPPNLSDLARAGANTMLHISFPPNDKAGPSGWGSVVGLDSKLWTSDKKMQDRFGATATEILTEHKARPESKDKIKPVLIRLGAPCDHAQQNPTSLVYVLGLLAPVSAMQQAKRRESIWVSPEIQVKGYSEPSSLHANASYMVTFTRTEAKKLSFMFRLRETLMMELVGKVAGHSSRSGIISFRKV